MIIGIQGKQTGQIMYSFEINVPKKYPDEPPQMRFVEPKMAMPCVDANGRVDIGKIKPAFQWTRECDLAHLLVAIRENMEDKDVCAQSESLANSRY